MPKLNEIVNYEYQGQAVAFLPKSGDAMVNATQMCKMYGKEVYDFLRLESTKTLIAALEAQTEKSSVSNSTIYYTQRGGNPHTRGTWVNRILAMELAGWLNVDFKLWVYDVLEKLLTEGEVKLKMAAPQKPKAVKKKRVIRRINPTILADMLYEICHIKDEKVRTTLAEQAYNQTRS